MESVSILLPIFFPNTAWLRAQLNSIADQTFKDFRCLVSHDGPVHASLSDELYSILPDNRFKLILNSNHVGTYRHVEYLISEFGLKSIFFALCDQDDVWLPKRLESQISHFSTFDGSAVSSNGAIVDEYLEPIRGKTTFDWFQISQDYQYFGSIRNQVTGASALFRSDRFLKSVPFPINVGTAVHDHWLYIVSLSTGGTFFDSETMWLYRQHGRNQIGASVQSGGLSRVSKGVNKTRSILSNRYVSKDDPVIRQGREFLKVANERWSSDQLKNDVLSRNMSLVERLKLLHPATLIGSSLESLRVAIS